MHLKSVKNLTEMLRMFISRIIGNQNRWRWLGVPAGCCSSDTEMLEWHLQELPKSERSGYCSLMNILWVHGYLVIPTDQVNLRENKSPRQLCGKVQNGHRSRTEQRLRAATCHWLWVPYVAGWVGELGFMFFICEGQKCWATNSGGRITQVGP